MNPVPLWIVDAFASRPFSGNPAAVCILPRAMSDSAYQAVAQEMNLSETAFLERFGDDWALRWFTPTVEVDLCGHATLAAAHTLWEMQLSTQEQLRFHTRSGILTAARHPNGQIALNFPALRVLPTERIPQLSEGLGVEPIFVGDSGMDVFAELPDEATVRAIQPEFSILEQIPTRGIIITARANAGSRYDFVSRFFAPGAGVDEDPVTGSAHCSLATFWGTRLGRHELHAYQASQRGGELDLHWKGDRVELRGSAATVLQGSIYLPGAG
ncbi:PhzF family phenazine biosynthesis protein [Tuwongella immobilis]|uniref:PhzF family phenazine biosynthesis protein n=1 Tax=Tuwongella immobilis TaxID=692036 RepID=A0A6C2YMM5_9BACT|nr:PhzF family phenazine biosynthesis protein [Tuwongella immobilis]VIP02571.1 phenazine biosynthesis protein family : Uncharacterized protein OS=Sorangium cellulosum So0157-2 GN=SCE1572_13540 PE=4 SV=1: PhzC-PhzF [Tuwongella immobilis]VTS01802.1 phenazine biosynthesis protein family : Uncharacterized protein OS=Sorangium cellulosum So0157-2 GN=SCE1572_13540 PE=4 SV=1: PhzC-PhzF [Tuwongella immobilis]